MDSFKAPHPFLPTSSEFIPLSINDGEGATVCASGVRGFLLTWFCVGFLILYFCSPLYAFSFAVFGDNRDGDETYKLLISKVNRDKELVFAVNTGDFVSNGAAESYHNYRKMLKLFRIPVYHVLGNHDGVRGGWRLFEKYFGRLYYSFDYAGSHFVILNNAFSESFDREQFNWLKADLAAAKSLHKFVFMHKPTFDPSEIHPHYIMSGRRVTEELMELFSKHKVDYVFAGHIHGYARALRGGVTYIITGGAGAPLYLPPEIGGFYHYVKIDVQGDKIRESVVRIYD